MAENAKSKTKNGATKPRTTNTKKKVVVSKVAPEINNTSVQPVVPIVQPVVHKDINSRLMDIVMVRNINPTIFTLKVDKEKTILFKGQETKTMLIKDVISVAGSTRAFSGRDGRGTGASLYIEDKDVRVHLGYETIDGDKQNILDEDRVLEILNMNINEIKDIAKETFNDIPKKALLEKVILNNQDIEAVKIKFLEKELNLSIEYSY